MKKLLITGLFLLSWATLCFAQDTGVVANPATPDIGGKWVLDKSKTKVGGAGTNPLAGTEMTMVIEISDRQVRVSRIMIVEGEEHLSDGLYYTDGRGESNPVYPYKGGEFQTTSTMVDMKLVTKWTQDIEVSGKPVRLEAEESWDPLRDGQTLVNSITTRTPKGTETIRLYYKRVS